jgi:hypothetical protein
MEGSLPLPRCAQCGLQILYAAMNGTHYETALCKDGVARKIQHAAAEHVHLSPQHTFTAYGEGLERVEVFKYLERLLAYDDNDALQDIDKGEVFSMLTILVLLSSWCTR